MIFCPIRSVCTYRELAREFVSKDIKGRFAGSVGGILWTLINPIVNIILYYFVFSVIMRIRINIQETGTESFFVYFLSGFLFWNIFSDSLSRSTGILLENANLITKVVFPVELLPAGVILSSLIVNSIGIIIFLIYLAANGYAHISWLYLFLIIPLYLFFISGLSCFLAALCVFLRDIRELLGIVLTIWFYATPIIYPVSMVPESFAPVFTYNPIYTFVYICREILLFHTLPLHMVLQAAICSLLSYSAGAWFFMKAKSAFGDVL